MCCKGVPSGRAGALLRIHSGTVLVGDPCGVGLQLTDSDTALTGGPSIFIFVSHSKATLVSRFLERRGLRLDNVTIRIGNHHNTDHIDTRDKISHNRNRRRDGHTHFTASTFTNHSPPFPVHPQNSAYRLLLSYSLTFLFIFSTSVLPSLSSLSKLLRICMCGLTFSDCVSLFFYDLRRRRRGCVSTKMTRHQCWNVCDWETSERDQPSKSQLSSHMHTTKVRNSRFRKEVHVLLPAFHNCSHQRGTKKGTDTLAPTAHHVQNCIKISKETGKPT